MAPHLDCTLFRSLEKSRDPFERIGWHIANFTILKKDFFLSNVIASDTAPGNMVI